MREENKHKSSFFIVFIALLILESHPSHISSPPTSPAKPSVLIRVFFSLHFFSLSLPPSSISAHIVYINNHNRLNLSTHRPSFFFCYTHKMTMMLLCNFWCLKKHFFGGNLDTCFELFFVICLKKNCVEVEKE